MLTWAVVFAALAAARHTTFGSRRFDLGNMTQALWSTAHGRLLEATISTGEQMSRLGSHVDPLLAFLTPLWWVWPSPLMLTTFQALALASGALPVYRLARKHSGSASAARNLALAYLLFPAVQWVTMFDFHPVALAIPLLLYFIWFLDEDRLLAAAVVGVLAAISKEDVPIVIAGIGIWFAIRRGRPLVGGAIATLALAWTAVALKVVVPHFRGGPSQFYGRWDAVGGSPRGMVETLVTNPGAFWDAATGPGDMQYLFNLLVPLLALWALEPLLALAASPILALNLLSSYPSMNSIQYQYVATIVACLFAASAIGSGKLGAAWSARVSLAALAVVAFAAFFGPIGSNWSHVEDLYEPSPRVEAIRSALRLVPSSAPVSTSDRIGAHVSERRYVYSFPLRRKAEWVVVDESDPWLTVGGERYNAEDYDAELVELADDAAWRRVFDREGVLVYRRVAPDPSA
jgi:uncharacterized membrane protein